MLLSNGPCKVPLKCDDNGFVLIIGKQAVTFTYSDERLWVYWLFQIQNRGLFAEHLRYCIKGDLSPMDIDSAIDQFVSERTPVPVDEYRLEDVPLMADPQKGMNLPIPCYLCTISAQHEQELMQMILKNPYDSVIFWLESWFKKYCQNYGLNYDKKCKGQQYHYLAESFLEQHGISSLPARPKPEANNSDTLGNSMKFAAVVAITIVAWLGAVSLFLNIGDMLAKTDGFSGIVGILLFMFGFFLLGLPLYLLTKKKK